jgi:Ca2+-binding RTX toxin-like protein
VSDLVPDGPQDFAFTATGGLTPATFVLDDDADGTLSNLQEFADVPRGTYTITADPLPGVALTGIDCVDTGSAPSTGDPGTRTATIGLEAGEIVTCTFTHERRPAVTVEQAAGQADPTSSGPVVFDVVFSEPVTGFDGGEVTLAGTAGATTAVVTGGPAAYTVAVSGMTGDGTIVATVAPGVAVNVDGSTNLASTSTDNVVRYDTSTPAVTVEQAAGRADPTSGNPVVFGVVFSEPVSGFDGGDVALAGTAGATTAVVTGGPAAYTVAVSGMTTDGTIVATVPPGVAADAAGNANLASTSTDNVVTYDATAPAVTVEQAAGQADPTSRGPIVFDVVFSEPVSGFARGDVTLAGVARATDVVVTGGPAAYTVTVSGITGGGTIVATVPPGVAADAAGNTNLASTSTDNVVTFSPMCAGRSATLVGTPGGDVLTGTAGPDVIVAFGGNDRIRGGAGNDVVCARAGDDTILGGAGDDAIWGGGVGNDTVRGGLGNDIISGRLGDDLLNGGGGDDAINGGEGNDTVVGGFGADVLAGGAGDDVVNGNRGDDRLRGGADDDRLDGAEGRDRCRGGTGTDTATSCEITADVP